MTAEERAEGAAAVTCDGRRFHMAKTAVCRIFVAFFVVWLQL